MINSIEALLPSIHDVDQRDDKVLLNLTLDANLRCFRGHFDDVAIVPGVAQLDWAITFAREYLNMQGNVQMVSVLKFQKLLLPDMQVDLEIVKKSPKKFTFSYTMGTDKFSSARVELS